MTKRIANVWAVNDGEKIQRDDLSSPFKAGNSVWDGRRIRIAAARNETVAFQVIVEPGTGSVENVKVAMSSLAHESVPGAIIENTPWSNEPNDYVGRRIEVFAEHYLFVPPELSTPPQWFYAEGAAPEKMYGWIPDALIPHDTKQSRPVPVLPNHNQAFWVDIYVPADEQFKPGLYRGQVDIHVEGSLEASLPVELELYDFALPDENHTRTMVYIGDFADYFPTLDKPLDAFRLMAHRHRFDLVGAEAHTKPFDEERLNEFRAYMNGEFYTPANGYEGPGQGVGERIFPVGMYGSKVLGDTPDQIQAEADKWVRWFEEEQWPGVYFHYLIDEPRPDKFDWINERAGIIKQSRGPGSKLPILTTRTYAKEIEQSIDIWCAGFFDEEAKSKGDANGQPFWFYNGYRPSHGSIILEAEAVDMRVTSWIKKRYDIELYFLWHSTHWRHNRQGPRGRMPQNVFGYPATFALVARKEDYFYGEEGAHWGNGDGILFYPGHDPYYPEQDRGINGPISSIRMKNLRRGLQDYEYMWLAEQNGRVQEVDAIVREAVPKALYEVQKGDPISWSPRGNDWDACRRQLADCIRKTN